MIQNLLTLSAGPRRTARLAGLALLPLGLGLTAAGCGAPQLFEGTPVGEVAAVDEPETSLEAELQAASEEGRPSAGDESEPASDDAASNDADAPDAATAGSTAAADSAAAEPEPESVDAGGDAAAGDDDPARGEDPEAAAAAEAPEAEPVDEPAEAAAPEAADDSGYIGRSASGGDLGGAYRLVDLRTGQHEGFTRFVWELETEGSGEPYFEAIEEARDGGGARIRLSISDLYGYDYVGSLSAETSGGVVTGVSPMTVADDAMMRFGVELTRPARFAVVTLRDPLRIVLDVYDE